ncbi:cysteine proteinase [Trichodelitschia bisporula]|uniref:Ubiquitin carboxyl-terminal hydrolase n=1 Tax=Trichodelitschia bisporula TaxID=703511 RepID=A0A6G1HVJ6_9PEZI|nr:cysteine proteinase [Trichodelitschia bisporula]
MEGPRPKRQRKVTQPDPSGCRRQVHYSPPYQAATEEEKQNWKGFCEIESDPAFFSSMLRDFGVKGVKVTEVLGLDEDMLQLLPQPIYGLIFLFQYQGVDAGEQEDTAPNHVWFATQGAANMCATVALLNIVNNIPDAELGPELRDFKAQTMGMTPIERGRWLESFRHIKNVHNSFARKIDMLNIDLHAKQQADVAAAAAKKPRGRGGKGRKAVAEEAAFHFVAYVPIENEIWRLDGLDTQPQKFGSHEGQNWLKVIAPVLAARMNEFTDGELEFTLLALVKDPLDSIREALTANMRHLRTIEARLDSCSSSWKDFTPWTDPDESRSFRGPDEAIGITEAMVVACRSPSVPEYTATDTQASLLEGRMTVIAEQKSLRAQLRDEMFSRNQDDQKTVDRKAEYGPFIQGWLMALAENGVLQQLTKKYSTKK